jgi:formate dehydrogenase subunit gamma
MTSPTKAASAPLAPGSAAPAVPAAPAETGKITRFNGLQRAQHLSALLLFTILVVTGMPQKYPNAFSISTVHILGGITLTRLIHRVAGFLFGAIVAFHVGQLIYQLMERKLKRLAMVPARKDFTDAISTLSFFLGLTKQHPKYDRYDYRQRFEYWGMVAGSLIMVVTGLVLFFPTFVARDLPGQIIPAAKMLHSNEGQLALLVVIVWHIYNVTLSPDVFPFDNSIFTGKISRERMKHEHSIELERLDAEQKASDSKGSTR